MTHSQAIQSLYDVESTLQIIAQAIEGEQISGIPLSKIGGRRIVELVSEQVGQAIEALEQDATKRARAMGRGC